MLLQEGLIQNSAALLMPSPYSSRGHVRTNLCVPTCSQSSASRCSAFAKQSPNGALRQRCSLRPCRTCCSLLLAVVLLHPPRSRAEESRQAAGLAWRRKLHVIICSPLLREGGTLLEPLRLPRSPSYPRAPLQQELQGREGVRAELLRCSPIPNPTNLHSPRSQRPRGTGPTSPAVPPATQGFLPVPHPQGTRARHPLPAAGPLFRQPAGSFRSD